MVSYNFAIALRQAEYLQSRVEVADSLSEVNRQPVVSESVVNKWLDGSLTAQDPAIDVLGDIPRHDPWGNAFQAIRDFKSANGKTVKLGIYTLGRDGISKTNGNDPDDLNTWDDICYLWYSVDIGRRRRTICVVIGLVITPIVYVGFLGVARLSRRLYQGPRRDR